jgi:hypothetical protein
MQTEFEFVLPHGYVDPQGTLHREGAMRMATAQDEVAPLGDPRVQANPAYLVVILLSRVVTRLGDVSPINPRVIEGLFAGDLAHLEDLYSRVNEHGTPNLDVTCPHCEERFEVQVSASGG